MKKVHFLIAVAAIALASTVRGADSAPATPEAEKPAAGSENLAPHIETLANETNRISYAIGVNIARNLRANFTVVNPDFLKLGITDVLEGGRVKLNEDTINASIARYNELANSHVKEKVEDFKAENLRNAERFLNQNGQKEGVTTLPSGLEYRVISPGKGATAKPDGVAVVQYHGRNLMGMAVDSTLDGSKKGPDYIQIKDALPFWKEVLTKMPLGAKWEIYVPPQLAYGDKGHDKIAPNELLIYQVEVVGVQ